MVSWLLALERTESCACLLKLCLSSQMTTAHLGRLITIRVGWPGLRQLALTVLGAVGADFAYPRGPAYVATQAVH